MTWKGLNPSVELVSKIYHSGVKLTQEAMNRLKNRLSAYRVWKNGLWIGVQSLPSLLSMRLIADSAGS